jgi:hypothetical protein
MLQTTQSIEIRTKNGLQFSIDIKHDGQSRFIFSLRGMASGVHARYFEPYAHGNTALKAFEAGFQKFRVELAARDSQDSVDILYNYCVPELVTLGEQELVTGARAIVADGK